MFSVSLKLWWKKFEEKKQFIDNPVTHIMSPCFAIRVVAIFFGWWSMLISFFLALPLFWPSRAELRVIASPLLYSFWFQCTLCYFFFFSFTFAILLPRILPDLCITLSSLFWLWLQCYLQNGLPWLPYLKKPPTPQN